MKKIIGFFLALTVIFQLSAINVFATESNDKVIAIVNGIEITEKDIDENGIINNSVFDTLKEETRNEDEEKITPRSKRYSVPSTLYVKKGHNALMVKKLGAPRFNQQTDTYFLNPKDAKAFAYKLTSSSNLSVVSSGILSIALGKAALPYTGGFFTITQMLSNLKMNAVRDSILKIANQNKGVEVRLIKTTLNYKPIYYVNSWNGTSIKTNLTNSGSATERLHFYKTN